MGNKPIHFLFQARMKCGEGANMVVTCTSASDLWACAPLIKNVKFRMILTAVKANWILEGCQ